MLLIVVVYDVNTESESGRKRLRRIAKVCEGVGRRVQNSVFECLVDESQWFRIRDRLIHEAELAEDSLRFYFLGNNWRHRVEHVGARKSYDLQRYTG